MTSAADQPISALRSGHNRLAALVKGEGFASGGVNGPSGAADWTIAQVLSHLGSGAEIGLASLAASVDGADEPAEGFNRSVWDRWNAMTPQEQADTFVDANEQLVLAYEALDDATRNSGAVNLGFLPAPVDVATAASFRLNEFALHAWDIAVASDSDAAVAVDAVEPMMKVIPFLIGWIGKPADVLSGKSIAVTVKTTEPDRGFGLEITDQVKLVESFNNADAELVLPGESWLRLATGRLRPVNTPEAVSVSGGITLAQLRAIFPGF